MKRYERKSGICTECGKPTEVQVIDESFAERKFYAVASVCCESPVLDDDGAELTTRDLRVGGYEG